MSKRLIISIDGGGIRGIIPLVFLRHLQVHLEKQIPDLVQSWYGTSTGALIAAGLVVQKNIEFSDAIQNVLDIYEFRSTSSANPLGTSNPARALNKIIDENFGSLSFLDVDNLNVVACKLPRFEIEIFNRQNSTLLAEAVKASCAVPGVFEAVQINGHHYVDGFVRAKNPAMLAIQNTSHKKDLIFLSLGTGILREIDDTEIQVRATHLECEALAHKERFHYFRFNPHLLEGADSMQDTRLKNIFGLKKDAENYINRKKDEIHELIELLKGA